MLRAAAVRPGDAAAAVPAGRNWPPGSRRCWGPAPAPVLKVNNRFRYRCTLVGRNDKATREMLAWLQKDFARDSANRGMNLFVDYTIN